MLRAAADHTSDAAACCLDRSLTVGSARLVPPAHWNGVRRSCR